MINNKCPFVDEYLKDNGLVIEHGDIGVRKDREFYETIELDDRNFLKVYMKSDKVLAELKNSTKLVFEYIFRTLQSIHSHNTMEIEFSYKDYLVVGRRLGIKKISERSFYYARDELIEKRIIAHRSGTIYWFNFNYFFNGNRFSVIREYVRQESESANPAITKSEGEVLESRSVEQPELRLNKLNISELEALTEEDCAKIPPESLKGLDRHVFRRQSPIWWAVMGANPESTKHTHAV